jgi:sortase A
MKKTCHWPCAAVAITAALFSVAIAGQALWIPLKLEVPVLGVSQVVLGGNSSRNLAFGPVLLDASSGGQDLVISGHRDTHFRFLRRLQAGDRIRVRHAAGERWYSVAGAEVIDSRSHRLVIEPGLERLSLVTCYPFDSPLAGGPLRYVVTALPFSPRSPSSG